MFDSSALRPWALLRSLRVRAAKLAHAARRTPAGRAKIGSPFDDIDEEFHAAYERARLAIEHDVPVFVVLADQLVFLFAGQRQSWSFTPVGYHLIKTVSHGPLAIFSSLQPGRESAQLEDAMGRRTSMQRWVDSARRRLAVHANGVTPEVAADLLAVLDACALFLEQATSDLTPGAVNAFAASLGPTLLRLIDAATQLQLDALHAHVEEALRAVSPEARQRLEVIVTGNHQARVRSLPMQYFKKRLQEPANVDGRVVYAEGVATELDALALVGTRRLDRALSLAFFGDPSRMQRDLLGDSAQARLQRTELPPLA